MKFDPCWFYVPASRIDKLIKSVPTTAGVALVIDLEDAVPQHAKPLARERLGDIDLSGTAHRDVMVRVNSIETPDGLLDIQLILALGGQIGGVPVRTVVLPKVVDARDVTIYRSLLSSLANPPEICSVIETVDAVENVFDIAAVSDGLCFGQADLVAEMWAPNQWYLESARARLCVAASRFGLPAIDTNSFEVHDMEMVSAQCAVAKRCGFTGKAAIHPSQVAPIIATFRVDSAELEGWQQTITDYGNAESGFVISADRVLAPPFVHKARRMLALHHGLACPVR